MPLGSRLKVGVPFAAFIFFGAVALFLWHQQNRHDRELVLRYIETSAEQVRIRLEGLMNARLASLELMAERWVERTPPDFSPARFQGFASALYDNYPGYSAIFWIDPSGVVQWIFPANRPIEAVNPGLKPYLDSGGALNPTQIDHAAGMAFSHCIPSQHGTVDFQAIRALVYQDELQGYLGGLFSVGEIMQLCLTKAVLDDFDITLFERRRPIFRHDNPAEIKDAPSTPEPMAALRVEREISFGGKRWTLDLTINQAAYGDELGKNVPILVFGLILAGALALLLHVLMQRVEMLQASRDKAMIEVAEREQVQAALKDNQGKLQNLLDELTAKNAELESFAYTVSHDLKTPIVTIEGFIGALREDFGDKLSPVAGQYLDFMSEAARKMERLISELLNYSRIGRLEGHKTRFSMSGPFEDAVTTLQSQIETRGVTISLQPELPSVYGDRKRIEQAVYNLLSNAVKYTGSNNAAPRIDIGCMEQNQETVFWVRDNGIGIDPRYFDKIFQIFERLPSAKEAAEGTGIGLAIIKRIIEHHGGRIWLTSELGQGTTFYFTVKDQETECTTNPPTF